MVAHAGVGRCIQTRPLNYSRARWDSRSIKQRVAFIFLFSPLLLGPVYCLGCGIQALIISERSFQGGINDSVLCRCFQGQTGRKEKRVTEGTEERKENGVLSGRRENLDLARAHEVEPVERRFGLFFFLYSTLLAKRKLVLEQHCLVCVLQFESLDALLTPENFF